MRRSGNYTEEEVRVLLREYVALRERTHKSWVHVRLIDLDRAMEHLTQAQRQAVMLVGHVESEAAAGSLLGVSQQAISKRLGVALDTIVSYLNGDDPE